MPKLTPDILPPAELFLVSPSVADGAAFAQILEPVLNAAKVASFLLRTGKIAERDVQKIIGTLKPLVQSRGIAFLVEDNPTLSIRNDTDGVQIRGTGGALTDALARLKPDRIVGVCGLAGKDDAMVAGETGADYLMFGEAPAEGPRPSPANVLGLVEWWSPIFNLPCVACATGLDDIGPLVTAGADFIAVGDAIWNDPRGPEAAIRAAEIVMRQA